MRKLIKNVILLEPERSYPGAILLEDGKIKALEPRFEPLQEQIAPKDQLDGKGLYLSPGLIDLHTHGAGGSDFMDGTEEAYETACRMHLCHGTTTIYPTTLSSSKEEMLRSIDAFNRVKDRLNRQQFVPGLHLEGPYFAMAQKGGQDPRYIRNPDPSEYQEIVSAAKGAIKRWSLAPELPGALEMGDFLKEKGILPAIGHSDATYQDCIRAVQHGYSHVTHLYSCTSTITRRGGFRILGVTESAYLLDELSVEIIADGCHLPPELIRLIVKCKDENRICLVTDSLRPAGLDVKEALIGSLEDGRLCPIEDGVAKLPDRTAFAGSIATADRLIRTLFHEAGIKLETAVKMMSLNPARVMGIDDRKGSLTPGKDADLVLFDEDIRVQAVFYGGRQVV